jgi:lysophospholipase L1-like esterase
MTSTPTEQAAPRSRQLLGVLLATLIASVTAGGVLGGYAIGRIARNRDIENVRTFMTSVNAVRSLYEVLGKDLDDPVTARALGRIYDIPNGNRDALADRLRNVAWTPPTRPAPFVGHMARPLFAAETHINAIGFRDERESYLTKPDRTIRVFITGGSLAWGTGASQKQTISYRLEQLLNARLSPVTGFHYEIVNAAFPAWSTTQEKLLIQQFLLDLHPDLVIMLSGNNDVHWSLNGSDIRWFFSYADQTYVHLLNELYRSSGHPEWIYVPPTYPRLDCAILSSFTLRNVEEAASALDRAKARLIFALQPNIVSTPKALTEHEQRILQKQDKPYWDACYQSMRDRLGQSAAHNYRLLDLSRSFGELDHATELFIDSAHVADMGNRLIAEALANQIDWRSLKP